MQYRPAGLYRVRGFLTVAVAIVAAYILAAGSPGAAGEPGCFTGDQVSPALSAPTGLVAANVPFSEVYPAADLRWSDNATAETCYIIERESFDDHWDAVAFLGADATHYRDVALPANLFRYRVFASDASQRSAYSEIEVFDIPIVDPPPTPVSDTPGDVDCDYYVNIHDIEPVLRALAGVEPVFGGGLTGCYLDPEIGVLLGEVEGVGRSDVNCDRRTDLRDVLLLLYHANLLPLDLPAGCPALGD